MLARLLAALRRTRGPLAARIARRDERARVLALLNARPDCGRGMTLTWRLWRHQVRKYTSGADPKARPARIP